MPKRHDLIPLVEHVNYLEHAGLIGKPKYGCPLQRLVATEPELRALLAKRRRRRPTTSSTASPRARSRSRGNASCSSTARERTIDANWEYAQERVAAAIPGRALRRTRIAIAFRCRREDEGTASRTRSRSGFRTWRSFRSARAAKLNPNPRDGHLWFAPVDSEVRRGDPRVPARARRGLPRARHGRQRVLANAGDVAFPHVHHARRLFDQPHGSRRQSSARSRISAASSKWRPSTAGASTVRRRSWPTRS